MAEDGSNGQQAAQAAQPSVSVIAQYVKDLSFENPTAPESLRPREKAPGIKVSVGVQPRQAGANDIEVELRIDAQAEDGDAIVYAVELVYAGLFRLDNVTQENLNPIMLIECPRLLFPFARQIISDAVRNGGFPPLTLDPIDFIALYRQRMAAAQQPAEAPPQPDTA
jgi:preprotein translocase subunit SecB